MKRLVIFDLDGTLLNTIADLAQSTNYALRKTGFPEHEENEYRFFVGNGINKLFERALPEGEKSEENISMVRKHFLVHYSEHKMDKSRPYPGIPELLSALHEKGVMLAHTIYFFPLWFQNSYNFISSRQNTPQNTLVSTEN